MVDNTTLLNRLRGQQGVELAALRARRQSAGLVAWIRGLRPFDRRSIRDPDERDAYWVNVRRRLAESDAAFLTRYDPYGSTERQLPLLSDQPAVGGPAGQLVTSAASEPPRSPATSPAVLPAGRIGKSG
jgi:hypothetical protein